jgi:hypothetical protein
MSQLLPCPNCHRHVRVEDPRCPFCEATLPVPRITASGRELPRGRVGRIAVLAAGATLMGAAASCDTASKRGDAGTGGQSMIGTGGSGAGGSGTGGDDNSPDAGSGGSGGSGTPDAGQSTDVPIAIYAAAVALPRNKA